MTDLFPGFSTRRLRGAGAEVFARVGGHGPPVLLLHGYPQTHACWHRVAPRLADRHTVVACDLRGYGGSGMPVEGAATAAFSKRAMAQDLVAGMEELGFRHFFVAGHDRGGRVAYRMALDHPGRVVRLAVLGILPTFAMWTRLQDNAAAMAAFHWFLMAQEPPLPETMIAATGVKHLHAILQSWSGSKDLSAFDPLALATYERDHLHGRAIAASCADYRAGWAIDRLDDRADLDAGRRIECPVLAIWGAAQFPEPVMLDAWRQLAADVTGRVLSCGHFVAEEMPDAVAECLGAFWRPEMFTS